MKSYRSTSRTVSLRRQYLRAYIAGGGRYNSSTQEIYGGDWIIHTPGGPITREQGASICGRPWFSPDGTRIYDGCGNVWNGSTNSAIDGTLLTTLNGVSAVNGLSISPVLNKVAVIPQNGQFSVDD